MLLKSNVSSAISNWNNDEEKPTSVVAQKPRWSAFIDPGWTLEREGWRPTSTYNRNWYNCSLISMDRLYYDVKKANAKEKSEIEHKFTDGILLTDLPDKNIKSVKLTLTINNEIGSTSDRYLLISKNPIKRESYNTASTDNLIDIYTNNKCEGTPVKEYKLTNAINNVVYFKDVSANDLIYIKIVWDSGDDKYTIITTKPIVKIVT